MIVWVLLAALAHAPDPRLGNLSVSHSFLHGGVRQEPLRIPCVFS